MEEHANYRVDFINATKTIKELCPYAKISGGIPTCHLVSEGESI
jgi:5-methyltetrahydrofolate--homocysteine methyltransferase